MSFKNKSGITPHSECYPPKIEIKDYNVKVGGKMFFDQPVKNDNTTYENIRKIVTGQGDDYLTGCLLDHPYFKENYKIIPIDLNNRKSLMLINSTN